MKTFLFHKRRILLITSAINLLLLFIVAIAILGPSLDLHAQMSWTQQNTFNNFCFFYYHYGKDSSADADTANCNKENNTFLSILKQETSSDNYTKWPQQVSLNDLAAAGLLTNPQNENPIKTQQDFLVAIPSTDTGLLALFKGDPQFLLTLWDYNSTYDYIPTCGTTTPTPQISASTCTNQPSSCSVNPQSFQHSDIWPIAGPMFLSIASQTLQNQDGQHVGIYDLYGRLLLQDHCSAAALAQTMKFNGQPIAQLDQAYRLEKDAMIEIATSHLSNTPLLTALIWAASQSDNQQLDSWFSSAIIANPIPSSAQPTPSTQPTPTATPIPSSTTQFHIQIVNQDDQYSFVPPIAMIAKGTTVVWTNASDAPHTVTSIIGSNALNSPQFGPNQTFQMVFNTAGTYAYHCALHPDMEAVLIVT